MNTRYRPVGLALPLLGLLALSGQALAQPALLPFAPVDKFDGGDLHSCALQEGRLWCWGENGDGQLGDGTSTDQPIPKRLETLNGVSDFAAGAMFTCAVAGGGVHCWGRNDKGQMGDGGGADQRSPVAVPGLTSGFARVVAGDEFACAVKTSGEVHCWGDSNVGQSGLGASASPALPAAIPALLATGDIAAGGRHVCLIDGDGVVLCWGDNSRWQLATDSVLYSVTPGLVLNLGQPATALALGDRHSCAVLQDGSVACWGGNDSGQLGDGAYADSAVPQPVSGLSAAVSRAWAGDAYSCAALDAGGAMCWGYGHSGQLGDGTVRESLMPVDVLDTAGIVSVAGTGASHGCTASGSGPLRCWGLNNVGQLGDGSDNKRLSPVAVNGVGSGVAALTAGSRNTCALGSGGGLFCWGSAMNGLLGTEDEFVPALLPTPVSVLGGGVKAIDVGSGHACAIDASDVLYCWGSNSSGALGIGSIGFELTPQAVQGLPGPARAVVVGGRHTCALLQNDSVWCWGANDFGQVGDGSNDVQTLPVRVIVAAQAVQEVIAGDNHSCARRAAGDVLCWGDNARGQLGDGSQIARNLPTAVAGLATAVAQISAGREHSCARASDGSLSCWGAGNEGQLGAGNLDDSLLPQPVATVLSFVDLQLGDLHSCAVSSAGAAHCWGRNTEGQLGSGSITRMMIPLAVSTLPDDVSRLVAGDLHSCAVSATAGLKCWGKNDHGQLGDGTAGTRPFPADVVHVPINVFRDGFDGAP